MTVGPVTLGPLAVAFVKATIFLHIALLGTLFLVWFERKFAARIQNRIGPYRVGRPFGYLQTLADVFKLLTKEDIVPNRADRLLFMLAPTIFLTSAILVWYVIPVQPGVVGNDLNIGVLYLAAVSGFIMIGIFAAGWAGNNKYSIISAMRAAAQLVSYEVPLVLSVVGVVMLAGSMSLQTIVNAQEGLWFVFLQPLGFLVFLTAGIAELNRAPFDLSEAESELIAGYNIEYSGMRWSFFFLAEFSNLLAVSAIATALFLGGWNPAPFVPAAAVPFVPPFVWFVGKTFLLVMLIMWIRWTLPRVRIDQLMELGWKYLLPVSLVNIAATGLLVPLLERLGLI